MSMLECPTQWLCKWSATSTRTPGTSSQSIAWSQEKHTRSWRRRSKLVQRLQSHQFDLRQKLPDSTRLPRKIMPRSSHWQEWERPMQWTWCWGFEHRAHSVPPRPSLEISISFTCDKWAMASTWAASTSSSICIDLGRSKPSSYTLWGGVVLCTEMPHFTNVTTALARTGMDRPNLSPEPWSP